MEEFFHLEQRYASADDVFIYVQSKRPDVSKHSVVSYLSQKEGIFVKVSKTEYGLTAWGGKPQFSKRKRRSHREIMKRLESAIPAVFADYEVDVLALSKLVHELEKRTDLKSVTIYTALPRLNLVELETHPKYARRKVAKYVGRLTTVEKRPRKTIREAVQEEVEKFLRKQPDHRALVSDIASQVTETVKCARHTFYSYLSGMQTVHKERVDGRLYCRLVTDKSYPLLTFPRLEEVEDESLKSNVQRAIRSLNVENVDLGLFQLGKILERELKDFLLEARRRHVFPVTNNDLQKFVSMIDCVERNGIVRNKHHLTLLRQERNERAHGAILNLKEREELMRQAPFLAGLFIEYITLFHKKRSRLCGTATS